MKPYMHAVNSVRKYSGKVEDYLPIHNFMDSSKSVVPDMRHRAIFHSAFGCFIVEKVFGVTITNSDNKVVSTRDIAEDHIFEDLGRIPTLQDWLSEMNFQDWMLSPEFRKKKEEQEKIKPEDIARMPELEKKEMPSEKQEAPPENEKPEPIQEYVENMVLDGSKIIFTEEQCEWKNVPVKNEDDNKPTIIKPTKSDRDRVVDGKRGPIRSSGRIGGIFPSERDVTLD